MRVFNLLRGRLNSFRSITKFISVCLFTILFTQKCNRNCFLFSWLDGMIKLRVTRMNHRTRMIAFHQFLFIDQIAGLERWPLPPLGQSARVWPVGGWNFDLANSDALVSIDSRASDDFAIRPTSGWNVLLRKIVLHCTRMRERAIRPLFDRSCENATSSLSFN